MFFVSFEIRLYFTLFPEGLGIFTSKWMLFFHFDTNVVFSPQNECYFFTLIQMLFFTSKWMLFFHFDTNVVFFTSKWMLFFHFDTNVVFHLKMNVIFSLWYKCCFSPQNENTQWFYHYFYRFEILKI